MLWHLWSAKGYVAGHDVMTACVAENVLAAPETFGPTTTGQRLPVVSDAASCTEGFVSLLGTAGVEMFDALSFTARHLLPALQIHEKVPELVLHPTCSSTHLGIDGELQTIAESATTQVWLPASWGCCEFAGGRGMLHPELTAAAAAPEAAEVAGIAADARVSCNRTCELGMSRATGSSYRHVLEVLEKASR